MRVALLCLALVGGCGGAGKPAPDRRQSMDNLLEVLKALQTVGDDQILSLDPVELESRAYKAIQGKRFDGLVLRVPARVPIRKHEKLTSIIAVEQSMEHARRIPLGKNAVAVVTRLGRGGCWLAPTFVDPPNKNPPKDAPDPGPDDLDMSDMRITGVKIADLRPEEFPWESGRLVLRIISEDWTSNAETATLVDEKPAPAPATRKIKLGPGQFSKGPTHPALNGPGAALALAGGKAVGSLSLKKDPEWPVTEDGKPAIPCVLLFKRPGILNPIVMNFHVPASAGEQAEAWFTVDLRIPAGKYSVYLLAGEHLDGPHPWETR